MRAGSPLCVDQINDADQVRLAYKVSVRSQAFGAAVALVRPIMYDHTGSIY